jgi:hypothetical protein
MDPAMTGFVAESAAQGLGAEHPALREQPAHLAGRAEVMHLPDVDPRSLLSGPLLPSASWEQRVHLALAGLACSPSVHNTQPWTVDLLDATTVRLRVDEERWLIRLDPRRRQLYLSLGCALHGLIVGARGAGLSTWVDRLTPDGSAATVSLTEGTPATTTDLAMVAALALRRTVRGPLSAVDIPVEVQAALQRAMSTHEAHLMLLEGGPLLVHLGQLTAEALRAQEQDEALREELRRWTFDDPLRLDGVLRASWVPEASESHPMPHRDFALGRLTAAESGGSAGTGGVESAPPLSAPLPRAAERTPPRRSRRFRRSQR